MEIRFPMPRLWRAHRCKGCQRDTIWFRIKNVAIVIRMTSSHIFPAFPFNTKSLLCVCVCFFFGSTPMGLNHVSSSTSHLQIVSKEKLLIVHSHLLVRATNERFLPTRKIVKVGSASESHWLQPVLVVTVRRSLMECTSMCGWDVRGKIT